MDILDDSGRRVAAFPVPVRIVSLVPSLTELVCALGADARLVGATRYCTHPPEVVAVVPQVSGTKNPEIDTIRSLSPDAVLVNDEENRKEDFEALERSGLRLFSVSPRTVAGVAESVERLGRFLATETAAAQLAGEIRVRLRSSPRPSLRVFCPIWKNPWMSFNRDTFAHDLLSQAGALNVCAELAQRYPEVVLAEIARTEPEVILLPSEPYRFTVRHLAALEGMEKTPACRNGRIHLVDGQALTWFGPRTPAALDSFRALLGAAADPS